MMIKVVNLKSFKGHFGRVSCLRHVDRTSGSPLGNPYRIGDPHPETRKPMTRSEVIELYRVELWEHIQAMDDVFDALMSLLCDYHTLGELYLGCHCAPKACHADVIKRALLWLDRKGVKK
jgi:hypothetical protein